MAENLRCPVCKSTNVECHGRHGHECLDCRYDGRQAVVTCARCGDQMWAAMDFEERVCGPCAAAPSGSDT